MPDDLEKRRYRIILKKEDGKSKAVNGRDLKNYVDNHLHIISLLETETSFEDDTLAAWWINKSEPTEKEKCNEKTGKESQLKINMNSDSSME